MQKLRVTKEFDFEAAHALDGYDGKCRDIHGHSYHLNVTIIGTPITDTSAIKCGMVIDFSDLKAIVRENIIDIFDHALILRDDSRFKGIEKDNQRVMYVNYQPTAENMLIDMVARIQQKLPSEVKLISASLRETANSYTEWFAEDNE